MDEIIDKVIEAIRNSGKEAPTRIILPKKDTLPLSKENFQDIPKTSSSRKIAFIDGGNNEILKTPSMSLQFIRVYYNIFQENKKIRSDKCEYYLLTSSKFSEGKTRYTSKIFIVKKGIIPHENDLSFDADDITIREGVAKAPISKMAEIARRFTEWTMCLQIINEIGEKGFIIKDGTLDTNITREPELKRFILDKASKMNIRVAGLAKTNSIIADNGESASKILLDMNSSGNWRYYPVAKDDNISFLKLNSASRHVFRLDIANTNNPDSDELISLLMQNSTDAVFPGYPYGLIDADRFARVSNNERDYLRAKLEMKMGSSFLAISKALSSTNAHSILDNV